MSNPNGRPPGKKAKLMDEALLAWEPTPHIHESMSDRQLFECVERLLKRILTTLALRPDSYPELLADIRALLPTIMEKAK